MIKLKSGFTLVELLITIALMAVLVSAGTTVTVKSAQRRQVDQAGKDLQGILEQARANALAGKKINCAASTLGGWGVSIPTTSSFTLDEYCGSVYSSPTKNVVTTKTYPSAITISQPTEFPIIFKTQGQGIKPNANFTGTAAIPIMVTGFGATKEIDIYPSGQISGKDIQ